MAQASAPPGIPVVPAPWVLPNTEAWWFMTSLALGPGGDDVPPGNFDPLETRSRKEATGGNFRGGAGVVQVLRLKDSPIGPYDELVMIPGAFVSPVARAPSSRITRIYVSTVAAVYNGRTNWNAPKHLARFTFMPSTSIPNALEIRVFAPSRIDGDATTFHPTPFFAALVQPLRIPVPALPVNLKYLPLASTLVQPPLEASESVAVDGLVGSDNWCSFLTGVSGKIKLVHVSGLLDEKDSSTAKGRRRIANGVDFPDFDPYGTSIHWPVAAMTFPVSTPLSEPTASEPNVASRL